MNCQTEPSYLHVHEEPSSRNTFERFAYASDWLTHVQLQSQGTCQRAASDGANQAGHFACLSERPCWAACIYSQPERNPAPPLALPLLQACPLPLLAPPSRLASLSSDASSPAHAAT